MQFGQQSTLRATLRGAALDDAAISKNSAPVGAQQGIDCPEVAAGDSVLLNKLMARTRLPGPRGPAAVLDSDETGVEAIFRGADLPSGAALRPEVYGPEGFECVGGLGPADIMNVVG